MSSSLRPERADVTIVSSRPHPGDPSPLTIPRTKARTPRTLRSQLMIGILALIVAVCGVIAVTTDIFLNRYLVGQVDAQLKQLQEIAQGPHRDNFPGAFDSLTCATSDGRFRPGQSFNSLSAVVQNGDVVESGIVTPAADNTVSCLAVPAAANPSLLALPVGGPATTVTIDGVGNYRAKATALTDGQVLISALPLAAAEALLTRLRIIMVAVTAASLVVGALAVFWIVRRSLRPLDRVAQTARHVASLPLDRGEVDLGVRVPDQDTDPRTEVGQVGGALNQMLGHVSNALVARQASETRVRQFVADASHELRTPLAAIRGYAELARNNEADAAGISHALRRVESESARMTTLVDDLLLLARLDAGRPLDTDEVDLTSLVVDAVSDARVAGADHRWRLDLPAEPVLTTGDQARLHQVLANLLANARTHTPPGTTVTVSLHGEPASSVVAVSDNGPGIPPTLRSEVFNRFVRGDSSRSRAAGSTGLGLAIVSAVVQAHGGTVTVESRVGATTFTVRLPAASAAHGWV